MIKQLLTANPLGWTSRLRQKDSERGSVSSQQLIHLIGLKRSGLHALSFWMLGHCESNMLLNNSPRKRHGSGSPMSRTDRKSPLPVVVRQGDEVATCRNKSELFEPLAAHVDLSIVLFQSQSLPYLASQPQLTQGLEATKVQKVLTLRDPFNWSASYLKKSQHPDDYSVWPLLWKEYADEFVGSTHYLPDAIKINYNRWFVSREYRQQISAQLGLTFTDDALEIVTPHAGGSSFDRTQFDAQAQQMPVTERWRHYENDPQYVDVFRQRQDILELGMALFDLPPDLSAFAQSCKC